MNLDQTLLVILVCFAVLSLPYPISDSSTAKGERLLTVLKGIAMFVTIMCLIRIYILLG